VRPTTTCPTGPALTDKFEISHVTLELECQACKSGDNVCLG
jgi:hypothetical protein